MGVHDTTEGPALHGDDRLQARPARPPGVLPRNVHYLALGGIAVLVISMTFVSGRKTQRAEEPRPSASSSQTQLKSFRDLLEQQKREAEEAKRRVEAVRVLDQQTVPAGVPQRAADTGEADELARRKRAKEEAARFASSFVIRSAEDNAAIDHTTQVAIQAEKKTEPVGKAAAVQSRTDEPKGSGAVMPSKDGDLFRLFEGTTIETRLANDLDGTFTGPVKCVVTKSVRSKDGMAVLIPEGSWFIGEARRVEAQNQARLAVVFNRLLLPNDYSVDLKAAPGLDGSGKTGLKDKVEGHRTRMAAVSGAIGLLGGLAFYAGGANPLMLGAGNAMNNSAAGALSGYLNAVPKITIRQGHPVMVYLPNDLLFPEFRP